jgi:hypothetical protein
MGDGSVLLRRETDGDWGEVASLPEERANCLLVPADGEPRIGSSGARLFRLAAGRLQPVDAFDGVEGRGDWYTPWGGPPDTRSLAEDESGALYANVHVGGIVRSRDGGTTWAATIDIDSDVHQVVASDGLVLAATAYGLAVSRDCGDAWRFETEGLHAAYCRAVAVGGGSVFLSASRSHRGHQAAVYRKPLEGGSFERCTAGLPEWFDDNVDTHCLAASGSRVVLGTRDGSVYLSSDGGETWGDIARDLPSIRCILFEE